MWWFLMKWTIIIDVVIFILGVLVSMFNSVVSDLSRLFSLFSGSKKQHQEQQNVKTEEPKYDPYEFKTFNDPMPPEEDIEWGNDAWWDVQKRYIDESLYVNHDWDIFKDDK